MSFANKLFQVVNDEPVYSAVLINLPEFKRLYNADKSEDKSMYAKQLAYIYYVADPKSPYFDEQNRDDKSMIAAFGKSVKISKMLEDCIEEYRQRQVTVEVMSLESSINTCNNLLKQLSNERSSASQFADIIHEIDSEIKVSTDLETKITLMNTKMEMETKMLDKTKKTADLIPKINKLVESIVELRERVKNKMLEIETKPGADAIENFLIDEFLDMD